MLQLLDVDLTGVQIRLGDERALDSTGTCWLDVQVSEGVWVASVSMDENHPCQADQSMVIIGQHRHILVGHACRLVRRWARSAAAGHSPCHVQNATHPRRPRTRGLTLFTAWTGTLRTSKRIAMPHSGLDGTACNVM